MNSFNDQVVTLTNSHYLSNSLNHAYKASRFIGRYRCYRLPLNAVFKNQTMLKN